MKTRLALLATLLYTSPYAVAMNVFVTGSVPITTEIVPALGIIEVTLTEILATQIQIGTAIVTGNEQLSAIVSEGFKAQREMDILGRQTERLEDARQRFTVPDSICSESASGVATQVAGTSRSKAATLRSGKGVSNQDIREALTGQDKSPQEDANRTARVHATYCTEEEYEAIGGTLYCPAVSYFPGGDRQVSSLYDGAGETGKAPALTFTDEQVDAAMAYLKNTTRRSAGRSPTKMDLNTTAGQEYQGVYTEYQAITDAAAEPQLSLIASSKPNENTKAAIQEAVQSPSAQKYYTATVSPETRRTGIMSEREFEAFEVGRRYTNTDYLTDLQAMETDNLTRELIRTQNLSNWLMLGIKNHLVKQLVIAGQQLALQAESTYQTKLAVLEQQMNSGGRNAR